MVQKVRPHAASVRVVTYSVDGEKPLSMPWAGLALFPDLPVSSVVTETFYSTYRPCGTIWLFCWTGCH